jgi:uncharacterized protein YbjT (DUF2867 family)
MRVAVAGGTGAVGRHVVRALSERGDEAVVLARSVGVDLVDGTGLDVALDGCEAVVDVATVHTVRARTAVRFFEAATGNLVSAAARAGVGHVVVLSIVGIEVADLGYYLGKRRQEQVVKAGPVGWTVLRATQFHEFPGQVLSGIPGPVAVVPSMLSAPVAACEVGAHLVELVHSGPQGMAVPIGGPQTLRMVDMARQYLAATGRRRLVVPWRLPGRTGRALESGVLVPAEPFVQGVQTFAEYLEGLRATSGAGPR